jgi:adenylate kinase
VCGGQVVQRDDDTETAIKRRLELYAQQTEPLVAYYMAQDRLAPIDGTGDLDTVTARLLRSIDRRLKAKKRAPGG